MIWHPQILQEASEIISHQLPYQNGRAVPSSGPGEALTISNKVGLHVEEIRTILFVQWYNANSEGAELESCVNKGTVECGLAVVVAAAVGAFIKSRISFPKVWVLPGSYSQTAI